MIQVRDLIELQDFFHPKVTALFRNIGVRELQFVTNFDDFISQPKKVSLIHLKLTLNCLSACIQYLERRHAREKRAM